MEVKTLDHIALWVEDRDRIADLATRHLGMHVIDRTDKFTLIGSDARRGKLTLFAAEGPRARGALKHVALRVADLAAAVEALPGEAETADDGSVFIDVSEGLRIGLVEAPTDVDYDFDHVALFSGEPEKTALAYQALGFRPAGDSASGAPRVESGGAFVEFHRGQAEEAEQPLLNHLAVLVDSTEDHIREANELGLEIADIVDAANTYALFVWGPERVKIEYVEHKASFSLV